MSEVIDVVTRLSYEANTSGIEKSNAALEKSILIIGEQQDEIAQLEKLRAEADKANLTRINQLTAAIEKLKQQTTQEIAVLQKKVVAQEKVAAATQKEIDALRKLVSAQTQAGDSTRKFTGASNAATLSLLNFGRIAQDAPFGILGIANNLNPALEGFQRLRAETGSNTNALKAMLGSLTGAAGLGFALSVVSSLLIVFSDKLFNSTSATEEQSKAIDGLTSSVDKLIEKQSKLNQVSDDFFSDKSVAARKRQLALQQALNSGSLEDEEKTFNAKQALTDQELKSLEQKQRSYEQLSRFFRARKQLDQLERDGAETSTTPFDLRTLVPAGIGFDEAESIYQKSIEEGVNILKTYEDKLLELGIQIDDKKSELFTNRISFNKEQAERQKKLIEDAKRARDESYNDALEEQSAQNEILELNDETLSLIRAQLQSEIEIQKLKEETRALQGIQLSPDALKGEQEEFEFNKKRLDTLIKIRQLTLKSESELRKANVAERFDRAGDVAKFRINAQELDINASEAAISLPKDYIPKVDVNRATFDKPDISGSKRTINPILPDKDSTKKQLDEVVSAYRDFATTIIGIINEISARQIDALDREIEVRSQRVEQAVILAERGNSEILKDEQDRLNEATRAREAAARRQVQLNALMGASNSALALTEAIKGILAAASTTAAEGGGIVGYIAGIVAGLAAVASLYASIRAAADSGAGFHDGKYTGDGDEWEPAGIVHKKEFVFNAKATERLGVPFLEALHDGTLTPHTASVNSNNKENEDLRKEVREVKEAILGLEFSAENKVDSDGVHQMVQTNLRRRRLMWSQ